MAPVVQLDVATETPFAQGEAFGETGPYRLLTGTANFAVDPSHPRNGAITDLDLAPRDLAGWCGFRRTSPCCNPSTRIWATAAYCLTW